MTHFTIFYHIANRPPRAILFFAKSAFEAMRLFKEQFPQPGILIDKII